LRNLLKDEGHIFTSDTDTEILSHLIEKHYHGDLPQAVEQALSQVEGSYAIAVVQAHEQHLVVARKDSPLILGIGDRENFVASDVPAILDYTSRVIYLEDGDIAVLTSNNILIRKEGKPNFGVTSLTGNCLRNTYYRYTEEIVHDLVKNGVCFEPKTGWIKRV